jgi:lipoyl-dependent peroxiredoxin
MPTRKANARWEGALKGGKGSFKGESGVVGGAYSFGSRFEAAGGTNPEELLAAAEASCFSMALASSLEKAGLGPKFVETDAACTVEKVGEGMSITTMKLTTRASLEKPDNEQFQKLAQETKTGCLVSRALAGLKIDVEATLV